MQATAVPYQALCDWKIQLSGDEPTLALMSNTLRAPELQVIREGDQFFLKAPRFNGIRGSLEILNASEELLRPLRGLFRLYANQPAEVIAVNFYCEAPGHEHGMVTLDSGGPIIVRGTDDVARAAGLVSSDETGQIQGERLLAAALKSPAMVRALQILDAPDEEWARIYKLLEIVEAELGGTDSIVAMGVGTKSQIKLLKRTANTHRHEAQTQAPPPNPMPLDEAKLLARTIVMRWIESVA